MSNESYGADSLDLAVGRNPEMGSLISISGHVDIFHTCAKSGKVTEHSGPNALAQTGQRAMMRGFTAATLTSGVTPTKLGIAFSANQLTLTAGGLYTFGTGNNIVPITSGITHNNNVNEDFADGCLFHANASTSAPEDVFTGEDVATNSSDATSQEIITNNNTALVLKATANNITINTIALVNSTGASAGDIFAVRGAAADGSAQSGSVGMAQISMNTADTLSVTWTIKITAS